MPISGEPGRRRKYRIVNPATGRRPVRRDVAAVDARPEVEAPARPEVDRASRHAMIAERAYAKAEARGFRGGSPDRDWIEAEAEIDALLAEGMPGRPGSS